MAEKTGKRQLGDRLMKGLWNQSSPQMGPFPPNEVSRIAQHVKKEEGKEEGKDWDFLARIWPEVFLNNTCMVGL